MQQGINFMQQLLAFQFSVVFQLLRGVSIDFRDFKHGACSSDLKKKLIE